MAVKVDAEGDERNDKKHTELSLMSAKFSLRLSGAGSFPAKDEETGLRVTHNSIAPATAEATKTPQ
jgi:hypothetical protein